MKEHIAKEKWCCAGGPNELEKCCASMCMAWRWADNLLQCLKCESVYNGEIASCPVCKTQLDPYRAGFCGLAGKPESLI